MSENPEVSKTIPATYAEMFEEYVAGQSWIGPADLPLVFHLRQLCTQLDSGGLDKASQSSAYLQAFSRLDRRRPDAPKPPEGWHPDQSTIFDEMD